MIIPILFLVSGVLSQVSVEAARKANFKKGDKVMALIEEGGYAGKCWLTP